MKIRLNEQMQAGIRCGKIKTRDVIAWLVNQEGFTLSPGLTIETAALSDLSTNGAFIKKAAFDNNFLHLTLA